MSCINYENRRLSVAQMDCPRLNNGWSEPRLHCEHETSHMLTWTDLQTRLDSAESSKIAAVRSQAPLQKALRSDLCSQRATPRATRIQVSTNIGNVRNRHPLIEFLP
jgi:hypothetical protein